MSNSPERRPIPPVPDFARLFNDNPVAGAKLRDWLRHLMDGFVGKPAPHRKTHQGFIDDAQAGGFGGDGMFSEDDPETLTLGGTADPGDPKLGAVAIDHVHPLDLGGLEDLVDIAVDPIYGLLTTDPKLQALLEQILFGLGDLAELLLAAKTAASAAAGDDEALVIALHGGM